MENKKTKKNKKKMDRSSELQKAIKREQNYKYSAIAIECVSGGWGWGWGVDDVCVFERESYFCHISAITEHIYLKL